MSNAESLSLLRTTLEYLTRYADVLDDATQLLYNVDEDVAAAVDKRAQALDNEVAVLMAMIVVALGGEVSEEVTSNVGG